MGDVFTPLDLVIFFTALIGVMVVGLIVGRNEKTSEDYFLAGRTIPWWGVAGSIFGSNVSANHMVGMMGIGFSIGFAQSHFELGAIFGLMMLCYGFLPVYRKLKIYTLSEYLGRRFDERSRLTYAVIMLVIMVVVQMVPALYIGARSICVLMGGDAIESVPIKPAQKTGVKPQARVGSLKSVSETDGEKKTQKTDNPKIKRNVNRTYYNTFIIALAVVAAGYTIFGGLKAVIWTDVIQSVLLLAAGLAVAWLTFEKVGGWGAMMAMDQAGTRKMALYRPVNDPDLPWSGVFTGLMALHCFYWGTNQFIVQRALGAKSDSEARLGIVAAGFLKLLIPFFAIGTGVAAFYLFQSTHQSVDPDAAFPELVKLVIPLGTGIVGLIAAGLIGAILSSIDSMMNSAATIITIDIYKRYVNPQATDRQMIHVGRISIAAFVTLAAVLAILLIDPNSKKNFFLQIVDYSGYLTPGLLIAFLLGMFWRRASATGAFLVMIAGIVFSWLVEFVYNNYLGTDPGIAELLGKKLNFFHRAAIVMLLCTLLHIVVSLWERPDEGKSRFTWTGFGGHSAVDLRNTLWAFLISVGLFALLGWMMVEEQFSPPVAGSLAAIWTMLMFLRAIVRSMTAKKIARELDQNSTLLRRFLVEDRFWAGLLCAIAVFMHYYFY